MTLVALLASPLLGPALWRPAAAALQARGRQVLLVPAPPRPPRHPDDVLAHLLSRLPGDRPLALVPHSGAGLYVPAVGAQRDVRASVLVDAALAPAEGATTPAPPAMHAFLAELADERGELPPWTRWWPEEQLAPLFPDAATRRAVEQDQHRLPLSYFSAELAVPPGWSARPASYLAFGDTYADERAQAAAWGWPVETLAGGHLHPLVDPAGVAERVDALLAGHGA